MASPTVEKSRLPLVPILAGVLAVLALVAGVFYLSRPAPTDQSEASAEAKAYLSHLNLSDVSMQASENFMKQQVIEVKGRITDSGARSLKAVDVFCLFYGVNGRELYRERVPIVAAKDHPLRPGETRDFRLPFDTLPEGWNQAMPRMIIARITFAS